jgi:probable HAF family extracellular repeat protein
MFQSRKAHALGLVLSCSSVSIAYAALPAYQVTDLGTLGGSLTQPMDLNEIGQVTGYSETKTGELRAFLFTAGKIRDLGTLGGQGSLGNAVNDLGVVTGFSVTPSGAMHAMVYANGKMRDIGVAGVESAGSAINLLGQVAGYSVGADGVNKAFLYNGISSSNLAIAGVSFAGAINSLGDVAGTYQDKTGSHVYLMRLGARHDAAPGHVSSIFGPSALNDLGQVTGGYEVPGTTRGFVYYNGRMTNLGNLGGDYSYGMAISLTGDITGVAARADGQRHAFVYTAGAMKDLGTLGGTLSFGYSINLLRQVAGESTLPSGVFHAFVTSGGKMVDLGSLLETLQKTKGMESTAYDINSVGQVAGRYFLPDAKNPAVVRTRAFIANPIPLLLNTLLSNTAGVGPGQSLSQKAKEASSAYASQDKTHTCAALSSLVKETAAQSGKKVPAATAQTLQNDARSISSALGCS